MVLSTHCSVVKERDMRKKSQVRILMLFFFLTKCQYKNMSLNWS